MQVEGPNLQSIDATVVDYINEIKSNYEQQIHELKNNVIDYQNRYLKIKERYDLLMYKRFARSTEQLQADDKQRLLFCI